MSVSFGDGRRNLGNGRRGSGLLRLYINPSFVGDLTGFSFSLVRVTIERGERGRERPRGERKLGDFRLWECSDGGSSEAAGGAREGDKWPRQGRPERDSIELRRGNRIRSLSLS